MSVFAAQPRLVSSATTTKPGTSEPFQYHDRRGTPVAMSPKKGIARYATRP